MLKRALQAAAVTHETQEHEHHHHGISGLLHKITHPHEHAHHEHHTTDPVANALPTEGSAAGYKNDEVLGGVVGAGGGGGIGKI